MFEVTEALAAGRCGAADPLTLALAQEPVSLACEAMNLAEALSLLATAAGVHIWAETANVNGRPVTSLRVWSAKQARRDVCTWLAGDDSPTACSGMTPRRNPPWRFWPTTTSTGARPPGTTAGSSTHRS